MRTGCASPPANCRQHAHLCDPLFHHDDGHQVVLVAVLRRFDGAVHRRCAARRPVRARRQQASRTWTRSCGWFPLARHIIPAATKWDTWHQLDADEEAASSAQARRRWPAEAIFSRVMQAPALQGKIPFHFLPHVDGAFLVACFDVLLMDFNVVPVAWAQCVADLGSHGLAQYPGLHLLAYLVNRSGANPQATSDTNDALVGSVGCSCSCGCRCRCHRRCRCCW